MAYKTRGPLDTCADGVGMNIPGMHYVGGFHASSIADYWRHLRITRPAWIVVVGAAQYHEARQFARAVQQDASLPTNVIFRHWTAVEGSASDNGRMSQLTARQWMERVGAQHIGEPYWLMPDNEGDGELNANAQADLIPLAAQAGLKLALGAWATHHPQREAWPKYMHLYRIMYQYAKHVVAAPHIYYSLRPSWENLDGFRLWARFFAHLEHVMGAPVPFPVVISEIGRLRNPHGTYLDANEGWRMEGISDDAYARELLAYCNARVWVDQRNMAKDWRYVVFSYPDWGTRGSLGITRRVLEVLENPPIIDPVDIQAGEMMSISDPVLGAPIRARINFNMNIRAAAGTDKPVVGSVTPGTLIIYWKPVPPVRLNNYDWVKLRSEATGTVGWVALVHAEAAMFSPVEASPPTAEPEPLPADIPDAWQAAIMKYVQAEVNKQLRDALHGVAAYLTALAEHEPATAASLIVFSNELVKQASIQNVQSEEKTA